MDPTTDKIVDALRTLRLQHPALGQKKALAQLNSDHNWALTNKDYKIHLAELEKQEAKNPEQKEKTEEQGREKSRTQQKKESREKNLEEGRMRKAQPDDENDTDPEMPELEEADTEASSTAQHQTTSHRNEQNCFLIRAAPSYFSTTPPRSAILNQISPFNLKHYGQEYSEMAELKQRLGWNDCREVGKFYDHLGTDSWYYYVYGQHGSTDPKNDVASLVCPKQIRGDVAVIRSGPGGSSYAESFTKGELVEAVEWYKTHDREKEFAAREKSRIFRTMGIGGRQSSMPHHYANMTSHGVSYS